MTSPQRFGVSLIALDARTSLVDVAGEIDEATSLEFENRLIESIGDAATEAVIVDLSEVSFVGSAALNALVRSFERRLRQGLLQVAIVASDARVTTIFEVSRLDRVFPLCGTRSEARALVAAPS